MIDDETKCYLRQRFNPDGSKLRNHQLKLLDMLKTVDEYCRRHGITYWLSSGTCLGAVRHAGFVPWDDDVDIEMFQKDYKRLRRAIKSDPIPGIHWQDTANDPVYVQPFAKFRDADTVIHEPGTFDNEYKYRGTYIDIFHLYPSNSVILAKIGIKVQNFLLFRPSARKFSRKYLLPFSKFIATGICFPIIRLLSRPFAGSQMRHSPGTAFLKARDKNDIRNTIRVNFEGVSLPIPEKYDKYLQRIYGDYNQLPDLSSLPSHIIDA